MKREEIDALTEIVAALRDGRITFATLRCCGPEDRIGVQVVAPSRATPDVPAECAVRPMGLVGMGKFVAGLKRQVASLC